MGEWISISTQGVYEGLTDFPSGDLGNGPFHSDVVLRINGNIQCSSRRLYTGLLTNSNRTPAQAAAQAEEPEACVSPAPRSQIKIEMVRGPVGTASWTLVHFGKIIWFSRSGPISRRSYHGRFLLLVTRYVGRDLCGGHCLSVIVHIDGILFRFSLTLQ